MIKAQSRKTQLELIRDIRNHFTENDLPFWLLGGWGIDFRLGRFSREHDDVDLIVEQKHFSRALELLRDLARITAHEPGIKIKAEIRGIVIDLCCFLRAVEGLYIDVSREDELLYPTPDDSFPAGDCMLGEYRAPAVSWAAQYVAKKGNCVCSGLELREKDRIDLELIAEHIQADRIPFLDELLPGVLRTECLVSAMKGDCML